jgi:hypothetical protein
MGRQKIANGNVFRPIRGFIRLCIDTHGFTVGYFRSSLRDFKWFSQKVPHVPV